MNSRYSIVVSASASASLLTKIEYCSILLEPQEFILPLFDIEQNNNGKIYKSWI